MLGDTGVCSCARTSAVGHGWGWAEAPRDLPGVASWGLLPCPRISWGSLEGVCQGAQGPTMGRRQECAWAWRQTSVSNPPWDPGHLGAPLPVTPWWSLGASAHPPPVNPGWSQCTAVYPSCQQLVGTRARQRMLASDLQRVSGSSSGPQMATSRGALGTSSHPRQQPLVGPWAPWHTPTGNTWQAPRRFGTQLLACPQLVPRRLSTPLMMTTSRFLGPAVHALQPPLVGPHARRRTPTSNPWQAPVCSSRRSPAPPSGSLGTLAHLGL